MSNADIWGLIYSYLYAFGLLGIVEWIGKRLKWPQWVTRKLVHIGAGMWVWGILYFFDNWYIGIIPFATFIVLNFIFYKMHTFKTMDKEDSSPGTIYFAISITLLFIVFWRTNSPTDRVFIAVAAIMAMTWGDALASLIGKSIGKRKFALLKNNRTMEGSLAMFIASFLVMTFVLYYLPGSEFSALNIGLKMSLSSAMMLALPTALSATVAEGISPAGTDNLTVPLLTALLLWLLI